MNRKVIVVVLLFTVSAVAQAAKPEGGQQTGYLGQTNGSYDGSTSMAGLYAACQTDRGEGAKVCNTKELFESANIAGEIVPSTGMWVRPFIIGITGDGSTALGIDYTGTKSGNFKTCAIANGATDGNYVDQYWEFKTNALCTIPKPAACCR